MEATQFNKQKVYILGAGGLARELESWITQTKSFNDVYELNGFLDDNLHALDNFNQMPGIISDLSDVAIAIAKNVIIGIANSKIKENIFSIASKNKEINLINFIHHFSVVGKNSSYGDGFILCPFSVISCNVTIGNAVTINSGSQIGHDVKIGNYSSIMANVDIGGGAVLGRHVFVGSNAVILPGVKIPDYTRIGAGSVVLKNIKQSGTYFGNPAQKII